MIYCQNKDLDKRLRELKSKGWDVAHGSKHIKACPPKGKPVFISATPSDRRGVLNILSVIRRAERECS